MKERLGGKWDDGGLKQQGVISAASAKNKETRGAGARGGGDHLGGLRDNTKPVLTVVRKRSRAAAIGRSRPRRAPAGS